MLQPILHQLKTKKIILASGSPRRQELIKNLGVDVVLCPSKFEENLDPSSFPDFASFVQETAYQKVLEVHNRISTETGSSSDLLVIGADTMVTLGDKLYGKPKTNKIAFEMLSELIGKKHTVYTGVAVKYGEKVARFTESTNVFFGHASPEQIQAYVDTGEPLDKAGGYGIQGVGGCLIERIEGDYFTVVGLPLYRLCSELIKLFEIK